MKTGWHRIDTYIFIVLSLLVALVALVRIIKPISNNDLCGQRTCDTVIKCKYDKNNEIVKYLIIIIYRP